MPPLLLLIGAPLAMVGGVTFLVVLFSHGGAPKSQQFRVIGELMSGRRGQQSRVATLVALAAIGLGSCLSFAGIAASDAERAQRCAARCKADGFSEGRIGPSVERDPKRRFVACTCTGGGKSAPLELPADSL